MGFSFLPGTSLASTTGSLWARLTVVKHLQGADNASWWEKSKRVRISWSQNPLLCIVEHQVGWDLEGMSSYRNKITQATQQASQILHWSGSHKMLQRVKAINMLLLSLSGPYHNYVLVQFLLISGWKQANFSSWTLCTVALEENWCSKEVKIFVLIKKIKVENHWRDF